MIRIGLLASLSMVIGCQQTPAATTIVESPVAVAPIPPPSFTIQGRIFRPEIAADAVSRARGLQHREAPNDGLILVFPYNAQHSLWMLNCPGDLEAWVISSQGVLLEVMTLPSQPDRGEEETDWQYQARLPRHRASHDARILWEFKAGTASELGLQPGQSIPGDWNEALARCD